MRTGSLHRQSIPHSHVTGHPVCPFLISWLGHLPRGTRHCFPEKVVRVRDGGEWWLAPAHKKSGNRIYYIRGSRWATKSLTWSHSQKNDKIKLKFAGSIERTRRQAGRDRQRQAETGRDRQRQAETGRDRQRQAEAGRDRQRQAGREGQTGIDRHRQAETS